MEDEELKSYLFRTYNGNKYILNFSQNSTIGDAIIEFESDPYYFRDVQIFPIENRLPNYKVESSDYLDSFSSRLFLLCCRYIRNSLPYERIEDVNEESYMNTPVLKKTCEKNKIEIMLLIQQFFDIMEVNPKIFQKVIDVAKKTNINDYKILNHNQDRIKEILKKKKEEMNLEQLKTPQEEEEES